MWLALAFTACTAPEVKAPGTDAAMQPGADSGGDATPADSVATLPTADSGGDSAVVPWDDPDGCSDIYDPNILQNFSIDISDAEWAGVQADYASGAKNYHPVMVHYQAGTADEEVVAAMLRLKGNPSFSWYDPKMQFVLAFNESNPKARFHGQRKISLDAPWYDPSFLRDREAWAVMRRFSDTEGGDAIALPFACANSATFTVNGTFYGAYTNIEFLDHEWLERNFGKPDATGTLWKYGTNPVANADASDGSAIAAMNATTDIATLATLGDLDEWVNEFAAEAVVGDDDGYWCCNHNFYLYEHPSRGILFVPWDFDDDFDVQGYDTNPISGYTEPWGLFQQPLYVALTHDPVYGPKFVDAVEKMNAAMDPSLAQADIDRWSAQDADSVQSDPSRSMGWQEHVDEVARMRAWVAAHHAYLQSWVACQRGETTDADGDGSPVCTDPNDADPTVYPGAPEICNGVDDNADGWIDDPASTPADPACDDCVRHDFVDHHFLFCRNPRSNADAEANCEAHGGVLTTFQTTGEDVLYYFYTWPITEPWWTGVGTGSCPAWDESIASSSSADCGTLHPSICSAP